MTKAKNTVAAENTGMNFLAAEEDMSHIDMDSNVGNEAVSSEDMQVPRLKLTQLISNEIKNGDPQYIDGCKGGDYFHSATRDLYGAKLYAINVFYKMMYNVWKDRKLQGGGLVGSFETEAEANVARNEACTASRIPLDDIKMVNDNFQLKPTGVHYLILLDPATGEETPVIFDMDGSKLKVSKRWNSAIKSLKGERFSHVWELTSFMESNDRNEDYYNTEFKELGFVNASIMASAKEAHGNISADHTAYLENKCVPMHSAPALEDGGEKVLN
jgi:hypothetical protein